MKETIYIGIDIAKYKHDFCIISSTGEVIVQNIYLVLVKLLFKIILLRTIKKDFNYFSAT